MVALTPNLGILGSINLTKAKQPQTLKYLKFSLCPFHNSKGVSLVFLCGTLFKIWQTVKIAYPHRFRGAPNSISMAFVKLIKFLFFLSATPLDAGEYGGVVSWIIPKDWTNELNSVDSYSRPLSFLNLFIFLPNWFSTSLRNSLNFSKASLLFF